MKKLISLLCFIPISVLSCQTNISEKKNTEQLSIVNKHVKSERAARYDKIILNAQENKLTQAEANEAFLIAKSYEFDNKLEQAEMLLEINYKFSPNVIVAMNLIQVKIALKKISDAKDIAKHARVIFPNNTDILLILIHIYQIENNNVQVNNLLDRGHKKFPKNEQIAILYAAYNKKDSKKILENFILRNPYSPNAMLKLSSIFYQEKKFTEALKYAKRSHSYDPDNLDTIVMVAKLYEILKNYAESEKYYRNAFEKDMENNINAQNYINILLFQKKQQEALSILLKLEASSDANVPFPPEFVLEIGRILIINEDYKGAKKRFESLLDPQYAQVIDQNEVLFFLAYSCENLHLFDKALNYIQKISPTSKIYSSAIREKIFIYINNKQNDMALKLINDFKINPSTYVDDAIFQSSILLFFNKNEDALAIIDQAIKQRPLEKKLYLKRLDAYIHMDKNTNFVTSEAKKVVDKWPGYADGLNMLGYLLIKNEKKLNYAEKLIKKAISLDNKNPFYLDSLGYFYFKKKNYVLAQKYFIDSLKYSPFEPVILYHYAKVLKLLHDDQEAEKTLEKARNIIANMLIYTLESDAELKLVASEIGAIHAQQ